MDANIIFNADSPVEGGCCPPATDDTEKIRNKEKEEKYVRKIIDTYRGYKLSAYSLLDRKTIQYNKLAGSDKDMIGEKYARKLKHMRACINANHELISAIVPPGPTDDGMDTQGPIGAYDMDKVYSTIRQLVRDWSEQGAIEREKAYGPIYRAIDKHYSHIPKEGRSDLQVLVPGAGLGRLAYDIARLGYSCQGNEYSFYMLLASNYVLNRCETAQKHSIYPWIHSFSNHKSVSNLFEEVLIPDIIPGGLSESVDFSMVAGEFLEVYSGQVECWDAVATCFFIDTAHNIIDYIRCIYNLLKPGAIWVNMGPLLFHYEDSNREDSIELTLEEVLDVARNIGFIVSTPQTVDCTYSANQRSMLTYQYHCSFFTAVKN